MLDSMVFPNAIQSIASIKYLVSKYVCMRVCMLCTSTLSVCNASPHTHFFKLISQYVCVWECESCGASGFVLMQLTRRLSGMPVRCT